MESPADDWIVRFIDSVHVGQTQDHLDLIFILAAECKFHLLKGYLIFRWRLVRFNLLFEPGNLSLKCDKFMFAMDRV